MARCSALLLLAALVPSAAHEFGRKQGAVIHLEDDTAAHEPLPPAAPAARGGGALAVQRDDAEPPLARLQQHMYAFQVGGYGHSHIGAFSPLLPRGCHSVRGEGGVLHVQYENGMCNQMMIYANARILAEQLGWGLEIDGTSKIRPDWVRFPHAPQRIPVPGQDGTVACPKGTKLDLQGAACPLPAPATADAATGSRCTPHATMEVMEATAGYTMERLLPFRHKMQQWFAPRTPPGLPVPAADDIIIHIRTCNMYLWKISPSGEKTLFPATAENMHNGTWGENMFCNLQFMTNPPVEFFDRVLGDIRGRQGDGHKGTIWLVAAPSHHRRCPLVQYLQQRWGAQMFTGGKDGVDDWAFMRSATGPMLVTSGTFGLLAAWLSEASEVHQPLIGSNKRRAAWSDARFIMHEVEDGKWFGHFSRTLGRFVFREGREVHAAGKDDCRGPSQTGGFVGHAGPLPCPPTACEWTSYRDGCGEDGAVAEPRAQKCS